jgi:sortase A
MDADYSAPASTGAAEIPVASPTTRLSRIRSRLLAVGVRTAQPSPSTAQSVFGTAFVVLSMAAIWLLLYALVLSGVQEHSAQNRLYDSIRYSLAEDLTPFGGLIKTGTPVAVVSAPEAGITRAVVVEGTTSGVLRDGPGHQQNTPMPGQAGVSVVMGRSVTFGAPFRHIATMHAGDPITVTTGQGTFRYTVTDVRGNGDPLPPLLSGGASRLTLVTSRGAGWRSGWAPGSPVFVDATMHGATQPAPAGRPTTIAPAATEMHGDTGGLVVLVLLLQGLLILSGAVVWARLRWGLWQAWLGGAPAVVAMLWLISGEAMRLLPNLA